MAPNSVPEWNDHPGEAICPGYHLTTALGLVGRSVRHERTLSFVLSRGSFRKPTVTGKLPYLGAAFTRRIFAFPIAQELAAGFLL